MEGEKLLTENYRTMYHTMQIDKTTWLLFHPYSLRLFEIPDAIEGRILKLFEQFKKESDVSDILNVNIGKVRKTLEEYENLFLTQYPNGIRKTEKSFLWIITTTACNFRCRYCYVGNQEPSIMRWETLKKGIDLAFMKYPIKNIHFFGGEPLLNKDVIYKAIKYISNNYSDDIIYSMATNGSLIDQGFIDRIQDVKFIVAVSIDGPPDVHNLCRKNKNSLPSFKDVMRGVELLKNGNILFSIEGTYSREAALLGYTLRDITEYLSSLSDIILIKPTSDFKLLGNLQRQLSPENASYEVYSQFPDYVSYLFDKILSDHPNYELSLLDGLIPLINREICRPKSCGQNLTVTIMPNGDFYSCHLLMDKDMLLGNIDDGFTSNLKPLSDITDIAHTGKYYWVYPFQDICPVTFKDFKNSYPLEDNKIPEAIKLNDLFWEQVIKNFYYCLKRNQLNKIKKNLKNYWSKYNLRRPIFRSSPSFGEQDVIQC